jgi:TonB family protein
MSRLQKKCLIASSAFHGLLVLIILFGAALMPEAKNTAVNRITFFDISKVTDGPTVGGGSAGQSQPQQQQQLPPPAQAQSNPQTPSLPEPRRETPQPKDDFKPKPAPPDSASFKPVKPKTQTDEFAPVDRTSSQKVKQVALNSQAEARARADAAARQHAFNQINNGIKNLGTSLSKDPGVQVDGGDNSGAAAANYRDIVAAMYTAAWNPPASLNDDSASVIVSVTIARDGHVIRHEIITPSGNADMDRSIETALENVSDILPFPAGSTDSERTYKLKLNLSAKRGTG